jgi:hypothetical protein
MYCISDEQIDFILNDLSEQGIETESLRQSLLDHICILVEQGLELDGDFAQFYSSVIKTFYSRELREIEAGARLLSTYKHHLALNKNQFFAILFIIFLGPFIGYDLIWLLNSGPAGGWRLPYNVWGATLIFALFPLLNLLVLYLTPERFDPLIPKNATILIGINPLIKIIA